MPLWTFVCEQTGEEIDEFFARQDRPDTIHRDGKEFVFSLAGTHRSHSHVCSTYPMRSVRVGVSPEQVAEARAADIKNGLPADYCPKTGDKIFNTKGERKRWCEYYGYKDRNGGYSDPQGR